MNDSEPSSGTGAVAVAERLLPAVALHMLASGDGAEAGGVKRGDLRQVLVACRAAHYRWVTATQRKPPVAAVLCSMFPPFHAMPLNVDLEDLIKSLTRKAQSTRSKSDIVLFTCFDQSGGVA